MSGNYARITRKAAPMPSPKMLREAANILETAPYQRMTVAVWLREAADEREQVQALWQLGFDLGATRGEPLLSHDEARELVRRGVRVDTFVKEEQ